MQTLQQQENLFMTNSTSIDDLYRKLGIVKEKERKAVQRETESDSEKNEVVEKPYSLRMVTSTKELK